jgi:CMP-N-acetylneuraminic acid synthetase
MKNGSIVGLIPIKGSSERVPNKNLRHFHGKSLYELKLQQLSNAKGFEKIIVSSESEKVLNIALENGFDIHKRDPKYSTSHVPMSDVYSYIASEIEGDNIAWLNATNPLAETEVYNQAIESFRKMDPSFDCLLSAINVQENLFYNGIPVNFSPKPWPRSQDLQGLTSLTFVINILKRTDMINWGSCVGESPYFYYMDKLESWDIDTQEDFDFCEMIYARNFNKEDS